MFNPMKPVLLALLLTSGSAFAQEATSDTDAQVETDTGAQEAETSTDTTPAEDDAASDLSLGEPVPGELQVGQPYIREEFGDWALRCLKAADDQNDPCQLYQLLLDDDGNAVAEISMFPLPNGGRAAAGATIVVPLETLLTEQLTVSVDGTAARRYPFTFCNAAGCVSRVGFTQEEVNQFKRGNVATIRLVPAAAPDEQVILNVSLSGFTAALDNTDAQQQ